MTVSSEKPQALTVNPLAIAQDLKDIARWVLWRYIPKSRPNGTVHWAKVPFQASGRQAASTKPGTWTDYDTAVDALIMGGDDGKPFDGLGFVFNGDDDVAGIDLDDCRDPITGELNATALETLERFEGYAEVSPSGTGLKLFTRMDLARSHKDDAKGIEMYKDGRYFTVTGHQINGHEALPAFTQDASWFIEKHFGAKAAREAHTPADAFEMFRPPLDGWPLDRVETELLSHLDPDMGYGSWVEVGMALHHQGRGETAIRSGHPSASKSSRALAAPRWPRSSSGCAKQT
jgi:hypothetical protein